MKACPLCRQEVACSQPDYGRFLEFACPACGELQLHRSLYSLLTGDEALRPHQLAALRFSVEAYRARYGRARITRDGDTLRVAQWLPGLDE